MNDLGNQGIQGKREQNKQANRAALLEAARRCFLDLGYDAVTVRDIVRNTDLASGTFYNYFPDKESMFREILEQRVGDMNARLHAVRHQARSIEEFIRGAYNCFFQKIAAEPDFFPLILRNEYAVRSLFKDTVIGLPMQVMKDDICDAIRRGVFPPINVDLLAAAFYGTAYEIGRALVEQRSASPEEAAEFATTLLTSGLRAFQPGADYALHPGRPRDLGLP